MFRATFVLFLSALLLVSCTGSEKPETVPGELPTLHPETAEALLETARSQAASPTPDELATSAHEDLLYFWPVTLPDEMKIIGSKSYASENGYELTLENGDGSIYTVIRGGAAEERYHYCDGNSQELEIRNLEGCYSSGTGAGAGVQWEEESNRYGIGGIGNSYEHVLQMAENLEALDLATWQQRLLDIQADQEDGKN